MQPVPFSPFVIFLFLKKEHFHPKNMHADTWDPNPLKIKIFISATKNTCKNFNTRLTANIGWTN